MKAIKPRETRLPIDVVREYIRTFPFVLKVKNRTDESTTVMAHEVKDIDLDFATHFFYENTIKEEVGKNYKLLMVPLALNGDE